MQKTVEVLQLALTDRVDDVPVVQVVVGVSWKVPQIQFIALPVCGQTVSYFRGFGGDVGVGIFRAPPGCLELSASFRSPR